MLPELGIRCTGGRLRYCAYWQTWKLMSLATQLFGVSCALAHVEDRHAHAHEGRNPLVSLGLGEGASPPFVTL